MRYDEKALDPSYIGSSSSKGILRLELETGDRLGPNDVTERSAMRSEKPAAVGAH
jgi:hypothetical protein